MQQARNATTKFFSHTVFDQYPWAANHNDAISCITRYMECNVESVVRRLDERILNKVAKDNWILSSNKSFS